MGFKRIWLFAEGSSLFLGVIYVGFKGSVVELAVFKGSVLELAVFCMGFKRYRFKTPADIVQKRGFKQLSDKLCAHWRGF